MSWPESMFTERGMFSLPPELFYPFSFNPTLILESQRLRLLLIWELDKGGDIFAFMSVLISDLFIKMSVRTSCLTPGALLLRHHFLSAQVDPTAVVHLCSGV